MAKTKRELLLKIKRLKRENDALIAECNAARARAGEANEAFRNHMASSRKIGTGA